MADGQAAHKQTIVKSSDRPVIHFGLVDYSSSIAPNTSQSKGSRQGLCTTGQVGHRWQILEMEAVEV